MSGKQAYLILAHKNWEQFRMLLTLIDDERNDIFLHIDKKSRIVEEKLKQMIYAAKHSNIVMVKRHSPRSPNHPASQPRPQRLR